MTNKKLTLFIVTYDFSFSKCIDGGEVYRRRGWREEVGSGGERHFKLDKGPSPIWNNRPKIKYLSSFQATSPVSEILMNH